MRVNKTVIRFVLMAIALLFFLGPILAFAATASPAVKPVGAGVNKPTAATTTIAVNTKTFKPQAALAGIPVLKSQIDMYWPNVAYQEYLAAQIEQETCPSLTSKMCWSTHAELKTSREYGFGWGQNTIAYNADGSVRFNNWEDTKRLDKSLADWQFEDRYNAQYQARALVISNRTTYDKFKGSCKTTKDCWAFTFSAYNGGRGDVVKSRSKCRMTAGCDETVWFGNVETSSVKSTRKLGSEYSVSAREVNLGYVKNILVIRSPKYVPFFAGKEPTAANGVK